ncbi:MAG: hypothetical protein MRERC_2c038 [Mycoplasmataceae bacterium RC_NB112A]|nr:MAG: hypothetical protein MRERC_2c038 [Mycoplasmataceae bacterium RC_NB112A]
MERSREQNPWYSAKNILYQTQITELGTSFDSQGQTW